MGHLEWLTLITATTNSGRKTLSHLIYQRLVALKLTRPSDVWHLAQRPNCSLKLIRSSNIWHLAQHSHRLCSVKRSCYTLSGACISFCLQN
jgi:hypothetical protein